MAGWLVLTDRGGCRTGTTSRYSTAAEGAGRTLVRPAAAARAGACAPPGSPPGCPPCGPESTSCCSSATPAPPPAQPMKQARVRQRPQRRCCLVYALFSYVPAGGSVGVRGRGRWWPVGRRDCGPAPARRWPGAPSGPAQQTQSRCCRQHNHRTGRCVVLCIARPPLPRPRPFPLHEE